MTDSTDSIFLQLAQVQDRDSAIAAAVQLADYFRDRGEFHRLFEARKFAARLKAGVAPFYFQRPPEMSPAQAAAIEAELLLACREVGAALASSGQPGAAWTYLQPLDDLNFVRELLEQTPRHEESLAELIQICLFERAHPEFGYSLVLQELGTCQAISAFDSAAPALDRDQRIRLAEKLIGHMHRELGANVRNAVIRARPELASELDSAGLGELLERFRDEVRQSTPHLDATHLVSAMRIGRQAGELESLKQGLDLARYGQLLNLPSPRPTRTTSAIFRLWLAAMPTRPWHIFASKQRSPPAATIAWPPWSWLSTCCCALASVRRLPKSL